MAQIKSYTSLEQSKKLAKILPLETADYCWGIDDETLQYNNSPYPCAWKDYTCKEYYIPCWSLASLLGVLPTINDEFEPQLHRSLDKYRCTYEGEEDSSGLWRVADNPVDACVAMIEKLNELNLLMKDE